MSNYHHNKEEINQAYRRFSAGGANRTIKIIAYSSLGLSAFILLFILVALLLDLPFLSPAVYHLLRGCAGIFAIIFFILYAILIYRCNKSLWKTRNRRD